MLGIFPKFVLFALCKRIHEGPGFRIPASRFRIPASGLWISTLWIPDSNLLDSSDSIPKWIPDSNSKKLPDSGFRIPDSLTWGDNYFSSKVRLVITLITRIVEVILETPQPTDIQRCEGVSSKLRPRKLHRCVFKTIRVKREVKTHRKLALHEIRLKIPWKDRKTPRFSTGIRAR